MPFTNQSKSSTSWSNGTLHTSTYANTTKDGDLFVLLMEDGGELLFEDGDNILLEEVQGDNLTTWTNLTKN